MDNLISKKHQRQFQKLSSKLMRHERHLSLSCWRLFSLIIVAMSTLQYLLCHYSVLFINNSGGGIELHQLADSKWTVHDIILPAQTSACQLPLNNHHNDLSLSIRQTYHKVFVMGFSPPIRHQSRLSQQTNNKKGGSSFTLLFETEYEQQYYDGYCNDDCVQFNSLPSGQLDTSSSQQQQQQSTLTNISNEKERDKLEYLTLAKEAHAQFFSEQMSQEEYVALALQSWNEANEDDEYGNNNVDGDVGGSRSGSEVVAEASAMVTEVGVEDIVSVNNENSSGESAMYQSQPPPILKGASSSSPSSTSNNFSKKTATSTINKVQPNQINVDNTSKFKSNSPFLKSKGGGTISNVKMLDKSPIVMKKQSVIQKQPPKSILNKKSSTFGNMQQTKFGSSPPPLNKSEVPIVATKKGKMPNKSFDNNIVNKNGGGGIKSSPTASSSSSLPNGLQPSPLSSVDKSSLPMNKASFQPNGVKSPLPFKSSGIPKGQPSSFTTTTSKFDSSKKSSFMNKSSSTLKSVPPPPPPLKGSDAKNSFSIFPSPPPPRPPSKSANDTENDSTATNSNSPFDLFGGLGSILFGKSKRPSPSTSLIGGLGMLNEYEESDVPYGLRVGKGSAGSEGVEGDNVGRGDDMLGDEDSISASALPPQPLSKGQPQIGMSLQKNLKSATTSFGNTIKSKSDGNNKKGQMPKKMLGKGAQFQPVLKKKAVTSTPPPAFQKGIIGNQIGKGTMKKGSTLVTKSPLKPPPPTLPVSDEVIASNAQSLSSSVLDSIDRNKEEIAQTKSWIENEKRLDDVRKRAAAIQGAMPNKSGVNPPIQLATEREISTTDGESAEVEIGESISVPLPTESSVEKKDVESVLDAPTSAGVTTVVGADEKEDDNTEEAIDDWLQEQNRIAQERAAARMAQEKLAKQKNEVVVTAVEGEDTRSNGVTNASDAAEGMTDESPQENASGGMPYREVKLEQRTTLKGAPKQSNVNGGMKGQIRSKKSVTLEGMKKTAEIQAPVTKGASPSVEPKVQNGRLVDTMKQPMKAGKPRSAQIPNGQYWSAEQNRLTEERDRARLAKDASRVQLKGSVVANEFQQQRIVPPKEIVVKKMINVANTGGGMPQKMNASKENVFLKKSVMKQQPPMQQQPPTMKRSNVEPAIPSLPTTNERQKSTTIRSSSESKMIEKGYVPFTGRTSPYTSTSTSDQRPEVSLTVPENVQQAVAPGIPINKIEPSQASQMIAPTVQKEASESRSIDLAAAEALAGSLDDIDVSSLPAIRVGNRIRSNIYGTTHQVLLILPNAEGDFEILPCVAKRPWTMAELYANVPSKVSAFEEQQTESAFDELIAPESWEVDYKAKSVRRYWEVEIHCNKKFQQKKELYERLQLQALNDSKQVGEDKGQGDGADDSVNFAVRVADLAISKFYDVYPDDGSGGINEDDIIPEYGSFGLDVWNKTIEFGHDWLVYESKLGVNELTLLDAMTMQHEINKQFLEDGYQVHHLYGIQQAMKLPDTFGFGDVLDVITRSLLENIAFLASCNVVHRNLNPSNIICDEDNGRLRIINFGDAVDLDPKETVRVGLDNDTLESNAPGAIANSLAADVFSVALVVCQLLFDFDEVTFTAQIKEVGYDLDAWLQRTLSAEERPLGLDEALWYLSERRGLWTLLKSMIKPNPLRRKITSASMQQFNEIIALKDGKVTETDQSLAAGDEAYLNSVLFPSKNGSNAPGSVQIPPASRNGFEASNEDIPQTQYTSTLPRVSQSSSVLSELAERINADAEQIQGTREEGPNSNPKMQNPAHTASVSNNDTYNDITRATFTPARSSKLTAMLTPKSRDPVSPKRQNLPELQSGNYYDITRASFERVSPQPMALTASQLYSILRESGAVGMPAQFQYEMSQQGYMPEADLSQSSYRGNNIVLPQRAISSNLPRGYVPARPTESISQEAYDEVEQWLLSHLPRLQKADATNYCWSLIDEGFDSAEMLKEIEFDDLFFMKKAHRRALVKTLSKEANALPEQTTQADTQSSPQKVYKVEEALGEAARKGIEALVAASKTGAEQTPEDRKQILDRFKAYEAKIAAEKEETERRIAEVQGRMQSEIRARDEEERELKELQDRIEAQLQIKAKEEQRLSELEREMEIRAKEVKETELKELDRLREVEKELKKQHHPTGSGETRDDAARTSNESSIQTKSETAVEKKVTTDVSPDNSEDWYAEQNRLVEERRKARLAKERKQE